MQMASVTPSPMAIADRYSYPTLFASIGEKFPEKMDSEQTGESGAVAESLDILSNFARPLPNHQPEEPEHDEGHVDLSQSVFREKIPPSEKESMHARARLSDKDATNLSLETYVHDSTSINRSLHSFHRKSKISKLSKGLWKSDDVPYDVENLDHLLDNHKTTGAMTVYTGIHHDPGIHFKPDANGKIPEHVTYHHPAYLSTTTEPKIAESFAHNIPIKPEGWNERKHPARNDAEFNHDAMQGSAKHVLQIHLPDQTKAASVWKRLSDDPYSPNATEEEILLHRGHNIQIHRTPTIHPNGKTVIWHAKIHSHDPAPKEDFEKYMSE